MNESTMKTMFSSKSAEWETDLVFFEKLNKIFKFTLDPCATPKNALCKLYFTMEEDGLLRSWDAHTVFMNPPYGRIISKWIAKAYEEHLDGATVVCLVPSRTDTSWMQKYGKLADWILDIGGRLTFDNQILRAEKGKDYELTGAPFPSRLIIFADTLTEKQLRELAKLGMLLKPIDLNTVNDLI